MPKAALSAREEELPPKSVLAAEQGRFRSTGSPNVMPNTVPTPSRKPEAPLSAPAESGHTGTTIVRTRRTTGPIPT